MVPLDWSASAPLPGPLLAADPDCLRCRGGGLVPHKDRGGYIFVEGVAPFKPELAAAGEPCPICRPLVGKEELVSAEKARHSALLDEHRQWEERTGWKLVLVQTRHAAAHTLLKASEAMKVGQSLDTLAQQLQKLGGLALVPTRPETFGLVLLWEKETWTKFRAVMQTLFEPQELGDEWGLARDYNSYDHFAVPHMYESPQTIRQRPPSYGAVYLLARRQLLTLARGRKAPSFQPPNWLVEGFACYGQQMTMGDVRWFSVYDPSRAPPIGNWQQQVRRLAVEGKLALWKGLLDRHLRDFTPADYSQSLGMVAFLLHEDAGRFIDLCGQLPAAANGQEALEAAYKKPLADLEAAAQLWLARWR
jgi:hypothetical protein